MKPFQTRQCIGKMDLPSFSLSKLELCSKHIFDIFDKMQIKERLNWYSVIEGNYNLSDSILTIEEETVKFPRKRRLSFDGDRDDLDDPDFVKRRRVL